MSDYLSKVPTLDFSKFLSGSTEESKEFSDELGIDPPTNN